MWSDILEYIDGPATLVALAFLGLVWKQYTEQTKATTERLFSVIEANTKAMTELTAAIKNEYR